jgi:protocatechuate 3,4-dioxygenase beta subunit
MNSNIGRIAAKSLPVMSVVACAVLATEALTQTASTLTGTGAAESQALRCEPTRSDMLGPFYKPNAPERTSVGTGHVLSGTVKSSRGCESLPGARIELWLASPSGEYTDDYRATVIADHRGAYRFESTPPSRYTNRPPHIHLRVTAVGHRTLVTQYYPREGDAAGTFALVLVPSE